MRTAVITPAAGRHRHLMLQQLGLAAGSHAPDQYVVVAMDDPDLGAVLTGRELAATVVDCPVRNGNLPLARARNLGAARAVERGAELLVFLDVDCVPGEQLLERYRQVALDTEHRRSLLCGTVSYLPAPGPDGYRLAELPTLAEPRPGRPAPGVGELHRSEGYTLFWSLSFAVTARPGTPSAGSARSTKGTAARTPTTANGPARPVSRSPGSAAPRPSTSTTRYPTHRWRTCATSCATPRPSTAGGAGGR